MHKYIPRWYRSNHCPNTAQLHTSSVHGNVWRGCKLVTLWATASFITPQLLMEWAPDAWHLTVLNATYYLAGEVSLPSHSARPFPLSSDAYFPSWTIKIARFSLRVQVVPIYILSCVYKLTSCICCGISIKSFDLLHPNLWLSDAHPQVYAQFLYSIPISFKVTIDILIFLLLGCKRCHDGRIISGSMTDWIEHSSY